MAKEITETELEEYGEKKAKLWKQFMEEEPPKANGEKLLDLWGEIYDEDVRKTVVETVTGPSDDEKNPVFPYEKLNAIVKDGGNWKWPRIWQKFDELERRGPIFRQGERLNFNQPNKNPEIIPQRVLIVGGGPIGLRCAIEMALGGHKVTIYEKRREVLNDDGTLKSLGFTNRINRPHMWPFVRNDLARLNGRDFLSTAAAYPVFTEPETSSIGIDEIQLLLMKTVLPLGVDFRLGVGFENAKVVQDPETAKPTWRVEANVDDVAAAKYGMDKGINQVPFDCLVGCDGPRSTVRETQGQYFGDIERRKFMDCVGIVANVRKVDRKRLKEMGFAYGQEPKDMNRTTMVFRDFFKKIQDEADADLENFIYYKASFHYYIIITPKRANLIKHGLSGRVYNFMDARSAAQNPEKMAEKAKLKQYCANVLKAAGIPIDENLPNGGFVDVPNDCMAFDFAECWNTKKGMSFSLPPPDYSVKEYGPWKGKKLYPYIALAGDALLEPFWPMGLGLKRGWQALMDTCYAIDNLYNRTLFSKKLGKEEDETSWDDHYLALEEQNNMNFEYCNRLKVSDALGKGEYDEKSNVCIQLNKKLRDAPKPIYEVEIDPWSRYQPLNQERESRYAREFVTDDKCVCPIVAKIIAVKEYYDEQSKGGARGEIERAEKKFISLNGRTLAKDTGGGYVFKAPVKRKPTVTLPAVIDPPAPKDRVPIKLDEVQGKSAAFQASLLTAVLGSNKSVDEHVKRGSLAARKSDAHAHGTLEDEHTRDEVGHTAHHDEGVAASSEAHWNRMTGKGRTAVMEADIEHVRNQIAMCKAQMEAAQRSMEAYKKAEKEMLMK